MQNCRFFWLAGRQQKEVQEIGVENYPVMGHPNDGGRTDLADCELGHPWA